MNPDILKADALQIAVAIANTDTDFRGKLLVLVGDNLRSMGQNFTGNMILSAAIEYGVNPKAPGHPKFKEGKGEQGNHEQVTE